MQTYCAYCGIESGGIPGTMYFGHDHPDSGKRCDAEQHNHALVGPPEAWLQAGTPRAIARTNVQAP